MPRPVTPVSGLRKQDGRANPRVGSAVSLCQTDDTLKLWRLQSSAAKSSLCQKCLRAPLHHVVLGTVSSVTSMYQRGPQQHRIRGLTSKWEVKIRNVTGCEKKLDS
jgi:hypothetical protein